MTYKQQISIAIIVLEAVLYNFLNRSIDLKPLTPKKGVRASFTTLHTLTPKEGASTLLFLTPKEGARVLTPKEGVRALV